MGAAAERGPNGGEEPDPAQVTRLRTELQLQLYMYSCIIKFRCMWRRDRIAQGNTDCNRHRAVITQYR
eukprot:SAG31_NODE_2682_length_5257_cov_9.066693_2_plen_68_part_00